MPAARVLTKTIIIIGNLQTKLNFTGRRKERLEVTVIDICRFVKILHSVYRYTGDAVFCIEIRSNVPHTAAGRRTDRRGRYTARPAAVQTAPVMHVQRVGDGQL